MPRPKLYPIKKVVGFDEATIAEIEEWRVKQKPIPEISDAIRQLVAKALSNAKLRGKRSAAATESASAMAGRTIDSLSDKSAPDDEQASRKRRLLQGPKEFRAMITKRRNKSR